MADIIIVFGRTEERTRSSWLAPCSVMLGSLVTIVPAVATFPWLPPFGLLMLLGWRLHRADSLKVWAAVPLGLFDDLFRAVFVRKVTATARLTDCRVASPVRYVPVS